jgi:hypothetical protein
MKYNFCSLSFFLLHIIRFSSIHGFFIAGALVSLMGCSGTNYIHVDAHQPVYFGSPPKGIVLQDSAHIEFIRPLVATTSHITEKEKSTTIKDIHITSEGVEGTASSIELEVAKAFEEDPDRFISDVSLDARVEVYMPWDTIVLHVLGLIFSQETTSEGGGDASSEKITITGKVYRQWRNKQ